LPIIKSKVLVLKSIQTYLSKVNFFIAYFGEHKKVIEITDFEITDFLNHCEKELNWSGVTYNSARISLNNYFKFLKINKYVLLNPVTDTETRKEIGTELHQVFSEEDFNKVMLWLKENDAYCLLFVRMIYYTCIRPKELRYLQVKHIDLKRNIITVPAVVSKNKKALPVNIDNSLRIELYKLNLSQYPEDYYLLGSTADIISNSKIGENTPYNRFQKCLLKTGLLNKNYTMYSFKHLSNVKKFKAGWTIAEICSANRHSSLVETETYLKDLIKFVQNDKAIPRI
jgi:integrase